MAAPTTPEDSGRAILAIFKVMGFGSGATLQTDQVQMQFAVNVGEGEGFASGPVSYTHLDVYKRQC